MLKTAGVILFLGWNSWKDIRKKEISLVITGIFAFLGIMTAFYNRSVTAQYFIPPFVGGGFLGISAVSGNQIGAGDGLLLIALGTVLETEEYLRTLCLSLIGCGLWAVILLGILRKKKTTELPFAPFVLLGYVGGLLL